mmetsp:Transcript_10927/g.24226  ORF Transcript_10927/g.24226 Transcript_10927/m.24226 type:complete len:327 (-) Transcript_10927:111-1091(-)
MPPLCVCLAKDTLILSTSPALFSRWDRSGAGSGKARRVKATLPPPYNTRRRPPRAEERPVMSHQGGGSWAAIPPPPPPPLPPPPFPDLFDPPVLVPVPTPVLASVPSSTSTDSLYAMRGSDARTLHRANLSRSAFTHCSRCSSPRQVMVCWPVSGSTPVSTTASDRLSRRRPRSRRRRSRCESTSTATLSMGLVWKVIAVMGGVCQVLHRVAVAASPNASATPSMPTTFPAGTLSTGRTEGPRTMYRPMQSVLEVGVETEAALSAGVRCRGMSCSASTQVSMYASSLTPCPCPCANPCTCVWACPCTCARPRPLRTSIGSCSLLST